MVPVTSITGSTNIIKTTITKIGTITYLPRHENVSRCLFLSVKESWSLGLPAWLGATVAHASIAPFPSLRYSQFASVILIFEKVPEILRRLQIYPQHPPAWNNTSFTLLLPNYDQEVTGMITTSSSEPIDQGRFVCIPQWRRSADCKLHSSPGEKIKGG